MEEKLKKYSVFINEFTKLLGGFFEDQKEFIKCTTGCSRCCTTGYYPITEVEYEFLKTGFNKLEKEKQDIIRQYCLDLYKKRKIFRKEGGELLKFSYQCPFLFNDLCSVYDNRAIICRTHGLMSLSIKGGNNFNIPTCVHVGLNYANIWDNEIKGFSPEKAMALNIKHEPKGFPIGYESVLENLEYIGMGDIRMLFEWILMDIPDYQKHLDEINKNLE